MKAFLEGTYGINNFGDELLLLISHSYLSTKFSNIVIAGRVSEASTSNDLLPSVSVGRLDIVTKLREIWSSDCIVIGGGGQFNDNSSITGGAHLALTFFIAILYRKPVVVVGTGFGPLKGRLARFIWRNLTRYRKALFSLREVRAAQAFQILSGRKPELVTDIVMSNAGVSIILEEANTALNSNYGLINFRNYRKPLFFNQIIEELQDEYNLKAIRTDRGDDITKDVWLSAGIDEVEEYQGVKETIEQVRNAKFVVTQRFHILVVSILLKKPVLPVCYANKMTELCQKLDIDYIPYNAQPADTFQVTKTFMESIDVWDGEIYLNKIEDDYLTDSFAFYEAALKLLSL